MKRVIQTFRISFCVFIITFLCPQCHHTEQPPSVDIVFENDKAVALLIRGLTAENNVSDKLKIRLIQAGPRTRILGNFSRGRDEVIFEPHVPLTRGLRYEVLMDDLLFFEIEIPKSNAPTPELI